MMYQRVLFAVDLEGVNHVVGEPYMGLSRDSDQWHVARKQAAKEINAAAEALFAAGVQTVGLWDNHGGGGNIDLADLDSRITPITPEQGTPRMSFARGAYDCICFFGYHTMEGTLGGVLAHTMNSKTLQYYKLNGRYIGEVDMDAYIAAEMGIPARFFAGGDITCKQAARAVEQLVTVETKKELGRNQARFRDDEALFAEIKQKIVEAVSVETVPRVLTYPAIMEKSYKRTEDAAKYLLKLQSYGIEAYHPDDDILGKDAHTVAVKLSSFDEFVKSI